MIIIFSFSSAFLYIFLAHIIPGLLFGLGLLIILPEMDKRSARRKTFFVVMSTIAYFVAFLTTSYSYYSLNAIAFGFIFGGILGTSILMLSVKFILKYRITDFIVPIIFAGGILSYGFMFNEKEITTFFNNATFSLTKGLLIWQIPMFFIIHYASQKSLKQ